MRKAVSTFAKLLLFFSPTLLFIAYTLFVKYTPIGATKQYIISASQNKIVTNNGLKYLTENNPPVDGKGGFYITKPQFFIMERLPRVDDSTTVSPTFDMDPSQELYMSFFRTDRYDNPHEKEELTWYPVTFPQYDRLTSNSLGTVYIHKDAVLKTLEHPQSEDLAELLKTYSNERTTVGFYPGVTVDLQSLVKTPSVSSITQITIPWQIRGDFGLFAYVPANALTITFTKDDINTYNGEDHYTVNISRHNSLVYTRTFTDDGIDDQSAADNPQVFSFSVEGIDPDIYHVQFISSRTDGERLITSDSTIKNITITASHFVTDATNISLFSPSTLYTKKNSAPIAYVNEPNNINIYPRNYNQPFDDGNLHITPGNDDYYTVTLDDEKTLYGTFSSSNETYFEPYSVIPSIINPDIWIVPPKLLFDPLRLTQYIKDNSIGIGIRDAYSIINTAYTPRPITSATIEFSTESLLK